MRLLKVISLRKVNSVIKNKECLLIPLQKTKSYFHSQFKRKLSYAYFDFLCSKATILNQKIIDGSDDDHLPSCCNGFLETVDCNNHIESGQIGIIYVHYDAYQKTTFNHLNIRNIFSTQNDFYIDFGLDILEKYWIKSSNPLVFIFSFCGNNEKNNIPFKINLSGILLNTYFKENNITTSTIFELRSKNIHHLSIKISANDLSKKVTVDFLNSVKIFKNTQLLASKHYFSQQKIHDENQQIGRYGEQFVKYRCFEYGFMVKPKTYDFGIDFMFYSFDENHTLEEKIAHFQIKSHRKSEIKDGFLHKSIKSKDIETWIHYLGPVFLIVVDVKTQFIYWSYIEKSTKHSNATTTIKIPTSNLLNQEGLSIITHLKNQYFESKN